MILCDCCGRQIFPGEDCDIRRVNQTKEDPYGTTEEWCRKCSDTLETLNEAIIKDHRKALMLKLSDAREKLRLNTRKSA